MFIIERVNLNNFITNNVTNVSHMFCRCSSLNDLNINNFNTKNVIYIRSIFYGC